MAYIYFTLFNSQDKDILSSKSYENMDHLSHFVVVKLCKTKIEEVQ